MSASKSFRLGEDHLNCVGLQRLAATSQPSVSVSKQRYDVCRKFRRNIDEILAKGETRYGINTGFGFLANVRISDQNLEDLQYKLIRSHACGVGSYFSDDVVRGLLVLRTHTFLLGYSGISPECVETLVKMIQADILPLVPEQGSVGASGDLAPLSHLALALVGEGQVRWRGKVMDAKAALNEAGITPHRLRPKEGLSLINGTHLMATLGALACAEADVLCASADVIAAMSLDGMKGTIRVFDERIHQVRPQVGQQQVAANFRAIFAESDQILNSHKDCTKVQDPYSFRCIPQVHGAVRDACAYARSKVEIDLNSVTDNPLCFEDGDIVSGGNFHGEPLALALDFLGIGIAELASIAERRIEKLTNPAMSGLPAFLMKESGLNSGFMIPHVVAAALVSENKVLAHPASVDTIPTSADQEDHVSMGPIAARKARQINQNVANVLAVELLTACQAIDMHQPLRPAPVLQEVYEAVRAVSGMMDQDRSLHQDIKHVKDWILGGGIVKIAQQHHLAL